MNKMTKQDLLKQPIEHLDITQHDVTAMVEAMRHMSNSARDLARAADLYDRMLADKGCGVVLCLAGSLLSAGLKKIFVDMVRSNMVDCIVSTGANIVDQDFFEALGFLHYVADEELKAGMDDEMLRLLNVNRIYDTLIDEDELRVCDDTITALANRMDPRPYSSREFILELGAYLERNGCKTPDSLILECYRKGVPIFCPAFSDCSAGFGLVAHQAARNEDKRVAIDSVKDFYEFLQWKVKTEDTGLFMIGGGVPKNFAQDVIVAADVLNYPIRMHKYAIQVTVADVRDGALSGSTLKEAHSWGKVDSGLEQMVWSEATIAVPLIVGYAYHKGSWRKREAHQWNALLDSVQVS